MPAQPPFVAHGYMLTQMAPQPPPPPPLPPFVNSVGPGPAAIPTAAQAARAAVLELQAPAALPEAPAAPATTSTMASAYILLNASDDIVGTGPALARRSAPRLRAPSGEPDSPDSDDFAFDAGVNARRAGRRAVRQVVGTESKLSLPPRLFPYLGAPRDSPPPSPRENHAFHMMRGGRTPRHPADYWAGLRELPFVAPGAPRMSRKQPIAGRRVVRAPYTPVSPGEDVE